MTGNALARSGNAVGSVCRSLKSRVHITARLVSGSITLYLCSYTTWPVRIIPATCH
jgi:hypothetical protein